MRLMVTAAATAAMAMVATAAFGQETASSTRAAAPAETAASAPAPQAEQAKVVADPNKLVCRSVRTTATRMAVRVCETVGEREARLAEERRRTLTNRDAMKGRGNTGRDRGGFR